MQLGFAKAHHKIRTKGKCGGGLSLEELPKIVGFPIIFLQRLGLWTLNLVHNPGLPRPTIKPQPEEKWAWPWAREAPIRYLGFPFSISATADASDFKFGIQLGFAKVHHKTTPRQKVGLA